MRANTFFRSQALEHQRQRLHGAVLLPAQALPRHGLWLVLLLAAGAVLLLWFGQYPRQERVRGHVVPVSGVSHVLAPQAGLVAQVHVSEGQRVQRGERLLSLGPARTAHDGQPLHAVLVQALDTQARLLNSQLGVHTRQEQALRQALTDRIAILRAEVAQHERQRELRTQQVNLADALVTAHEHMLEQDVGTRLELEAKRATLLDYRVQQGALQQSLLEKRKELADAGHQLQEAQLALDKERAALQAKLAELDAQRATLLQSEDYALSASLDGVVSSLSVKPGQTVTAEQALLALVPVGSALEAHLFVPTHAAGFIEPGLPVKLLLDAFPSAHFGVQRGVVQHVTDSVLSAQELPSALAELGPVYRISVPLSAQPRGVHGDALAVRPGMLLWADVVLEERRLLFWLLEPILEAWRRG